MQYAPSISDFETGFFLLEKAHEPYFLVSTSGQVLRTNKVGERYLSLLHRQRPKALENLIAGMNDVLAEPGKKMKSTIIGQRRKRVLRATPVGSGAGYLVEIDRV